MPPAWSKSKLELAAESEVKAEAEAKSRKGSESESKERSGSKLEQDRDCIGFMFDSEDIGHKRSLKMHSMSMRVKLRVKASNRKTIFLFWINSARSARLQRRCAYIRVSRSARSSTLVAGVEGEGA
ncbi:hypothetical protein EVAR_27773_1 [Eumeta japonica]|uniref:Uncharacterized protein n=1 Tax=Eumeta variegata TaxID=151549 RepID=A0A4C1VC30_EUMVA|nr:hypothetical protein EVAR_27773_1 [Eumeta japonica]